MIDFMISCAVDVCDIQDKEETAVGAELQAHVSSGTTLLMRTHMRTAESTKSVLNNLQEL